MVNMDQVASETVLSHQAPHSCRQVGLYDTKWLTAVGRVVGYTRSSILGQIWTLPGGRV